MSERRYSTPLPLGEEVPFSKGLMARALTATGLDPERAYLIALRAEGDLDDRGATSLAFERLGDLAADVVGDEEAARTVRRLRQMDALRRVEEPVLLLVGGATGTGKSTIATEVAHRLGITRVTSTDFIRQTMRAFFSQEFMPSVHYSSFETRLALTRAEEEESGDASILGFLDQTRNVLTGVHAALERAATERWSMVLEGVHIVPGMVAADQPAAYTVQCVVAVDDESVHRSRFWVREFATDGLRPLEKYLEALPQIREIQDFIVERARRYDVPVITSDSVDSAIGSVLDLVLRRADHLTGLAGRAGSAG